MTERRPDPASESLDLYLREIGAHPLLDRDAEARLARRIREGDREALRELVAANLRFVVAVAKRYRNHGVALADLVNEGNLGLIRAAEKFDETRGVRFISYAVWWIRQAILQAIAEQSRIVRVPAGRIDRTNRILRESRALTQRLGRPASVGEIAAELDLPTDQVREALASRGGYLSLDAPVETSSDTRMLDVIPDDTEVDPDEDAERAALRDALEASLTHLPEREAMILRLYFGLEEGEPKTLEAIGTQLGVSRERVRQIKDRALTRLRLGASGAALASFLGD
ncbi:MAG: RNA polymerase sigma factor RpoD/SigA [Gemmatimonadota bacterium]